MLTSNVKKKGISSDANIITALRSMKGKTASPNMGSATSNRYVAPVAPSPTLSDLPSGADNAPGSASTSEISLSVAQLGPVQPGDRISITVTRVSGGMAFGRPTIATGSLGPSSNGSNLPAQMTSGGA